MKFKVIAGLMLTLVFSGMSTLAFKVHPVKPAPTTIVVQVEGFAVNVSN